MGIDGLWTLEEWTKFWKWSETYLCIL